MNRKIEKEIEHFGIRAKKNVEDMKNYIQNLEKKKDTRSEELDKIRDDIDTLQEEYNNLSMGYDNSNINSEEDNSRYEDLAYILPQLKYMLHRAVLDKFIEDNNLLEKILEDEVLENIFINEFDWNEDVW